MDSANLLPGQRKVPVDQAFRLALEHHAAGRRPQAEALVRQVVQLQPGHAAGWQLLGIIQHEKGDTRGGLELLGTAIRLSPLTAPFYANRAEMNRLAGNLDQAIADGEQAVRLDPRSPMAHSNLGIACYHKGDIARAEVCQRQALALDPSHLQALNNLGSILRDRRDREGAAALYRKVVALRPDYLESANNLGAVLTEMENPEAGLKILLDVVRRRPDYAEAHCNIGHAFLALENAAKAAVAFTRASTLKTGYAEAYEGLARACQEQRNLADAEKHAHTALELKPGRAQIHALLGNIYSEQAYPEKAAAAFNKALEIDPDMAGAHLGLGHLQMEMGKMDAAEASFRRALELDSGSSLAPRVALTQVRKTREGDENLAALMAAAKDIGTMPETRAISLHFALGKGLEDIKRHDEAFPHYLEGCRLKRKRIEYSADNTDLIGTNICQTITPELLQRLGGAGDPDKTPIFVLGMPRSGTTLTETIIASHPDVYGAGELPDLMHLAGKGNGTSDIGYPLNLAAMSPADMTAMGARYIAGLRTRAPAAPRITDKMPANFMCVGLIHLMLPNAKIVHIKRNAVDTCLSGFTRLFHRSQYQSYDLREMGRYYRNYLKIMQHWRQVLPPGSFYELKYEQLVANQEEESRKLIAYCGLEWNDACLTPDKTERNVKTASVTQVRQPVYQSSVERWRVYEKFLGPLLEELGDAAYE
ncbi:MAG: sulfotransferase [Pseudomonadota bacterium]